ALPLLLVGVSHPEIVANCLPRRLDVSAKLRSQGVGADWIVELGPQFEGKLPPFASLSNDVSQPRGETRLHIRKSAEILNGRPSGRRSFQIEQADRTLIDRSRLHKLAEGQSGLVGFARCQLLGGNPHLVGSFLD